TVTRVPVRRERVFAPRRGLRVPFMCQVNDEASVPDSCVLAGIVPRRATNKIDDLLSRHPKLDARMRIDMSTGLLQRANQERDADTCEEYENRCQLPKRKCPVHDKPLATYAVAAQSLAGRQRVN